MKRWEGAMVAVVAAVLTGSTGVSATPASGVAGPSSVARATEPAGAQGPPGRPLSVQELDLGDGSGVASAAARVSPLDGAALAGGEESVPGHDHAEVAPGAAHGPESANSGITADSGQRDTGPFSVFGVSWEGAADATVWYRVRGDGAWSTWAAVHEGEGESPQEHGEDASAGRRNTDALAIGSSDGVHVVVQSPSGPVDDVKTVLIDPGDDPAVAEVGALAAAPTVPRPSVITRAQWGADESLRTCSSDYTTSLVSAAVHHTVSTNTYAADEAAGVVRGIYAYHTRPEAAGGRGWCDVGYNALVDRFGRIYEGRAGSFDESVVGVHTGGFNARTFGVSVIGNYDNAVPTTAVLEGVSQAIAWKFATERILGNAVVTMESGGGASKHPAGTVVTFPTIYGHRDAQLTSCPGQQLYDRLPVIRDRVSALVNDAVNASPVAIWESASTDPSTIRVAGWAFDPESSAPVVVDVVVDRVSHPVLADRHRPDVGAAYPAAGSAHGFQVSVPVSAGSHVVCVWARNVGGGNDHLLGCRQLRVANAAPVGFVDQITTTPSSVRLSGWALDEDTTASIPVHVYADGVFLGAAVADESRPDVGAAYPALGAAHGFSVEVPVAAGAHRVCVYAINAPAGHNPAIGCRSVSVVNAPPVGFVDQAAATPSSVRLSGWALDPDTSRPVSVHVYVGGRYAGATTADAPRPDVGAAYPALGPAHGFSLEVPAAAGTHQVCAYAINSPAGHNPAIACRSVTVVNATPVGFLDEAAVGASSVRVSGWAADADTSAPITVHAYVGGRFAGAATASLSRPDVAAAGYGAARGYRFDVPAPPGATQVCLWAINAPAGYNPSLGCRDVVVR